MKNPIPITAALAEPASIDDVSGMYITNKDAFEQDVAEYKCERDLIEWVQAGAVDGDKFCEEMVSQAVNEHITEDSVRGGDYLNEWFAWGVPHDITPENVNYVLNAAQKEKFFMASVKLYEAMVDYLRDPEVLNLIRVQKAKE